MFQWVGGNKSKSGVLVDEKKGTDVSVLLIYHIIVV